MTFRSPNRSARRPTMEPSARRFPRAVTVSWQSWSRRSAVGSSGCVNRGQKRGPQPASPRRWRSSELSLFGKYRVRVSPPCLSLSTVMLGRFAGVRVNKDCDTVSLFRPASGETSCAREQRLSSRRPSMTQKEGLMHSHGPVKAAHNMVVVGEHRIFLPTCHVCGANGKSFSRRRCQQDGSSMTSISPIGRATGRSGSTAPAVARAAGPLRPDPLTRC